MKLICFHERPARFEIQKLTYFHGWPATFKFQKKLQQASMLPWNWFIFTGDLPILIFKSWHIFTGDLPFSNSNKKFSKHLYFLEIGLFSWATYPFQIPKTISTSLYTSLKLVYFYGRPNANLVITWLRNPQSRLRSGPRKPKKVW
jgi:hypothetical protein